MTLLISSPILLAGMVVGLIVGLAQALTQVQEQTVAFVPKLVIMILGLSLCLPWLDDADDRVHAGADRRTSRRRFNSACTGSTAYGTNAFLVFTLVLSRVSGLMMTAPIYGSIEVPIRVRALLVFALALLVTPSQVAQQAEAATLIDYGVLRRWRAGDRPGAGPGRADPVSRSAGGRTAGEPDERHRPGRRVQSQPG